MNRKRSRSKFTAKFKAPVAIEALKERQTLAEFEAFPHTATNGRSPAMFRKAWDADPVITCYDKRRPTMIKLPNPIYQIFGVLSQRNYLSLRRKSAQRN
jgi:hypothetical protein